MGIRPMPAASSLRRAKRAMLAVITAALVAGCSSWQGANSLPLPGTVGTGTQSYTVQAQLPDVGNMERNSRVRVGDVTVGNVSKIERQGWHALVTMSIRNDIVLPANATATVGQTSLLGSLHVELAPPQGIPPVGRLTNGSMIPLSSGAAFPSTEQALASLSVVLNGGGLGEIQDITKTLSTAFQGRENDLRNLINQIDTFVSHLNDQSGDIIAASESLNALVTQLADQKPVLDRALVTVPDALSVLNNERDSLADALTQLGRFSALAADLTNQTKESLIKNLQNIGPVVRSLADAGPALTRSLDALSTFPFSRPTVSKWIRGDYANLSAVIDLTLSRIDASLFTGTRFEGDLTELEMQWGRTIGQMPSPYTARNPLIVPYHFDQGR